MTPFWEGFTENFRNCGRSGAIFLVTIGLMGGVLLIAVMVDQIKPNEFLTYVAAGFLSLGLFWMLNVIRRGRTRRSNPWKYRPLASDERRIARSKLKSVLKSEPVPKPPDTDLKY
jgi:hypothetical protein